jgi:hypothetical protein
MRVDNDCAEGSERTRVMFLLDICPTWMRGVALVDLL